MKFSLKKILKNKYIHFLLLGLIFLGIFLFIGVYKIKEGFDSSIGEYAYLAPIPPNTTLSQATQTSFTTAYNNNNKGRYADVTQAIPYITEEEAKYYIANGKFPWGSYIINSALKMPNVTQQDIVDAMINIPSRLMYKTQFLPTESKQTPAPLSYQIYMGTAQPPSTSSSTSSSTVPSVSSPSSQSNLSNSDYQSLTSICRNVLGQN